MEYSNCMLPIPIRSIFIVWETERSFINEMIDTNSEYVSYIQCTFLIVVYPSLLLITIRNHHLNSHLDNAVFLSCTDYESTK